MTKFQIINEQIYYLIIKQFSAGKIRLIVTIVISNIKSVAESIPSISTMLSISWEEIKGILISLYYSTFCEFIVIFLVIKDFIILLSISPSFACICRFWK